MVKDINNNPYRQQQPVISKFQQWLDKNIGSNYQERANYQNELLAAQWDSENNLKLQDREYNSPQNQAELMRKAGINPDLSGGVSPFESQTSGNPLNSGLFPDVPDTISQPLQTVANGILQGLQLAIGVRSGLLNLKSLKLDNDAKAFSTAEDVVESLFKMGEKGMELPFDDFKKLTSSIKNRTLRRQTRDWYNRFRDEAFNAARYKSQQNFEDARGQYINILSNPFYTDSRSDGMADQNMINTLRDYNEMYLDIERISADFQKRYMKSQGKALDVQDSQNDFLLQEQPWKNDVEYQKAQRELQSNIQKRLNTFFEKQMDKDNLWSQILLMTIFSSQTGAFNPVSAGLSAAGGVIPGISTLKRTFNPVKAQ